MNIKKIILFLFLIGSETLFSQSCDLGGCSALDTNATGRYPSGIFSTPYSTWTTVSSYMNAGNYTIFNVTNGDTYEWSYCSNFGGNQNWDAELTLFNNTGTTLCYQDNSGTSGCTTAPYLQWTATYTGTVKLLTTVSGCGVNTGSPYSKLVWRDVSGTPFGSVLGVDVYSGNGTINWNSVHAAGYVFAYAKATEGVGYTDSQYLNYAVNGVAAGMKMGAYHFARPDLNPTNAGAIAEANSFLSVAAPYITNCELPPALDLEGGYLTTSFTSAQLTAWVQNWMNTVQSATGVTPALYIGASTVGYLNSSLNVYPLWRDELTSGPSAPTNIGVWTTWTFNQYSWTGTVPGIAGSMTDLNVFNGTPSTFNNFMNCTTTGISSNDKNMDAVIYPNPASDNFQVDIPSFQGEILVSIYDISGKQVLRTSVKNKTTIDVSGLSNGLYTLSLTAANQTINKKLLIIH
jgi:GH25 family lysozyme M1 (1,4-beta-N-acetylmuramidase)